MRTKPEFLKGNGLVRVNGYVGRIADIAQSDDTIMVKIESAKCARRFQKPDWLEYTATPSMWEPATFEDLLKDAEQERQAALKSAQAVEEYVKKIEGEMPRPLETAL